MEHRGCDASDLAAAAREIVESNLYVTLATADAEGRPWASPVWFAHEGYRDFLWVSRPGARHSRNLAARPELALVIFDSTAAEGDAAAV
jgi:nitroimidazol reductase NimA-like FMN-containing flavoprotein (pyridoxamine 5'-phosphate oxidase superfamily)